MGLFRTRKKPITCNSLFLWNIISYCGVAGHNVNPFKFKEHTLREPQHVDTCKVDSRPERVY